MAVTKYIITTTVQIRDGEVDKVLELFKKTNPRLVKDQSDWVKAIFSKNAESNSVMVQAFWTNKESYFKFSQSKLFQDTMEKFGVYFASKPQVKINEILFEM